MPPDRVFGRIEKELKTIDTIITVQEYIDVLKKHGTILKIWNNFEFFDQKTAASLVVKNQISGIFDFL